MIRLELWNGAGGDREKRVLREFEQRLPDSPVTETVWDLAIALAQQARTNAVTIPATDLLIAACARHHGADLETADSDFARIADLHR